MGKRTKKQEVSEAPSARIVGKDEMNLAEFPIGKLGARDNRETLVYEGWITDASGRRIKQKWIVSGSKQYGLPHELGNRILVAFITLAAAQQSKKVSFVDHQMLKMLRLSRGKANYQHFERNLLQLGGLTIYSEQAFWDNEEKRHITTKRAFHIFEDLWLSSWTEGEDRRSSAHGYVVFNDVFWHNIETGYLKSLNLELYLGTLKSSIARQLYRCLDKMMRYRNQFEIDVFDLANRIGLNNYAYPSQIKQKLQPALAELTRIGFLKSATFVNVGEYTRIRFVKASGKKAKEVFEPDLPTPRVDLPSVGRRLSSPAAKRQALYERYNVSQETQELWQQVLQSLQPGLATATYYSFVEPTLLLRVADGTATILAMNPAALDWLQHRLANQIKSELNYFLRAAGSEPLSSIKVVVEPKS